MRSVDDGMLAGVIQRSAAATWFLRVMRGLDEQTTRQRSAATQHVRDGIYDVMATSGQGPSDSALTVGFR